MSSSESKLTHVVAAGVIGNSLEVYDYNLYGYYAAIFATLFFNSDNLLSGLLASYGIFAAGFIMRPVGALIFGYIGDRWGRKKALELSILLMAIPTALMGVLPGYVTIGLLAPLLLTTFRLLQGVAVGGELVGSFSFLIEHAPENKRAFFSSWSLVGTFGGKLWAAMTVALFAYLFSEQSLKDWAWRIPFFLGLVFAFIGYRIRLNVSETPVFQEMKRNGSSKRVSAIEVVRRYKMQILQLFLMTIVHTVSVYLLFIYMPIFLSTTGAAPYFWAVTSTALSLAVTTALLPMGGLLADRFGRKPFLFWGTVFLIALAFPSFYLFETRSIPLIVLAQCAMSVAFALMHAPFPAIYVELFPPHVRYTATAIAYNLSTAVFGGFTPLLCTWLVAYTDSHFAPLYWLTAVGIVSSLAVLTLPETKTEPKLVLN